ncbi:MAG: hypothetical protein KatS3mg030_332 [Saprospiraceae bacterium]|nr:MAG: hypothetical protein KatS3mg030_332 [Saprospiraceae bacterium]
MGSEHVRIVKTQEQAHKAKMRLLHDLEALEWMLDHVAFAPSGGRIGAEQELSLVSNDWVPAPVAMEVLQALDDPHYTTEFARFNLEINLEPLPFEGEVFSNMERQLWRFLARGEEVARSFDAHFFLAGIVPTLTWSALVPENITPLARYKFLIEALRRQRGDDFEFRIQGLDQWIGREKNSFIESSNTSFQVHYQVSPEDFAPVYNWAQLLLGPFMAATCNSPLLMGKRLWRETRIALFEQSTDVRNPSNLYREAEPRVTFGTRWVENSVLEIFRENILKHQILLEPTHYVDPFEKLNQGQLPSLSALAIHNGTVYRWNRPCIGYTDGQPHLRIENRNLPAGPTVIDEMANAAFWLGLLHGMPESYRNLKDHFDYRLARRNFYEAARQGLAVHLYWPGLKHLVAASDILLKELLPIAEEGLRKAGVIDEDISRLLGVMGERIRSGRTADQWTIDAYEHLLKLQPREQALVALTAAISKRQQEGKPVHEWDLPGAAELSTWVNRYFTVEQIMKTDLYTARPEDPLELVIKMMYWNNIRHVPVEDRHGRLVGILSARTLLEFYNKYKEEERERVKVADVMERKLITVSPQTLTTEAIRLLKEHKIGCLPVVFKGKLAGLVTERDFVNVVADLLAPRPPQPEKKSRTGESEQPGS